MGFHEFPTKYLDHSFNPNGNTNCIEGSNHYRYCEYIIKITEYASMENRANVGISRENYKSRKYM